MANVAEGIKALAEGIKAAVGWVMDKVTGKRKADKDESEAIHKEVQGAELPSVPELPVSWARATERVGALVSVTMAARSMTRLALLTLPAASIRTRARTLPRVRPSRAASFGNSVKAPAPAYTAGDVRPRSHAPAARGKVHHARGRKEAAG